MAGAGKNKFISPLPKIKGVRLERSLDNGKDLERILEDDFREFVQDFAEKNGWYWFHDYTSRYNKAGFPDNIFIHSNPYVFLVVEFKAEEGHLSPEQIIWNEVATVIAKQNGGFYYMVAKPSDWQNLKGVLECEREPKITMQYSAFATD